jgi:uncharacterized protein YcgL (UPF0745 family)
MIEERLAICKVCSIYNASQEQCSSILYVNPENNDLSLVPKDGYIKGCGCYIPSKAKREANHCPAGKW